MVALVVCGFGLMCCHVVVDLERNIVLILRTFRVLRGLGVLRLVSGWFPVAGAIEFGFAGFGLGFEVFEEFLLVFLGFELRAEERFF